MHQIFIKNDLNKIVGSVDPSSIQTTHVMGTDKSQMTILLAMNHGEVQFRGISENSINAFYAEYGSWLARMNEA